MNEESRQPPPDRWARTAMDERRKLWRRDGFLILAMILIIFGFCYATTRSTRGDPNVRRMRMDLVNNLRQLGLALSEFEIEFGKYPEASTMAEVKKQTGTGLTLTDASSNDLFRQLLVTKIVESESIFRPLERMITPSDQRFDKDTNALVTGECGLAYVIGPPPVEGERRPIAFGPVKPGTRTIDPRLMKGAVVVLFTDGAVNRFLLNKKGAIAIPTHPFDPSHPVWNGKPLEIKWPH